MADEGRHLGEFLGTVLHVRDAGENAVCEVAHADCVLVEVAVYAAIQTLLQEHFIETADATVDCSVDILPQGQHLGNDTNSVRLPTYYANPVCIIFSVIFNPEHRPIGQINLEIK